MRKVLAPAVVALVLLTPSVAHAAPQYVSSDPEQGAELHEAPERVRITFSEPLDASSKIVILDECDHRIDAGDTEVFANEMTVSVDETPSGHYRATYSAVGLGGVTGTTKGAVEFHVHAGTPCGDQSTKHHDHDDDDDDDKDHADHDDDDGKHEQSKHGDHDDEGSSSSDHTMTGHTPSHTSATSDHNGHQVAASNDHRHHKKNAPSSNRRDTSRRPPLAGGPDIVPPDDGAVLLALGLSTMVGAMGGVFLRLSARRI